MTDYAVVVGIARYPGLSIDGMAADLAGPDNDAQAVRDWLVDPDGGGLDPVNVRLVRSSDFDPLDPAGPQPATERVEREMDWIEQQTRATVGGRLYLYFSGHGFAPRLEEGALFTAEATALRPSYVYAHAWLRWFRHAQRFRESVLWMDCCMNYRQSIPTNEVLIRTQVGTGVPGPAFVALAAQTKSALEHTMADGRVHGVFTWTLLKGLRGGAADERGRVTGDSLRTFLHNVMPEFLPDAVRRAGSVDLQPHVRADEGLVFRQLPAPPRHRVRLTVPPTAVGARLRIWADRPYIDVVDETLTGTVWQGELERGLYVAELPGLRHGFQVSGAGEVAVTVSRAGPAVLARHGGERFTLQVRAASPAASITVTDYAFERVFAGTGELRVRDKPGVYKVRAEVGRDITRLSEQIVLLDRDLLVADDAAPPVPSPAPIEGSAQTHGHHRDPFYAAADRTGAFSGAAPGRCALSVLSRFWTAADAPPAGPAPHPMTGLRLIDAAGQVVAHLSRDCQVDDRAAVDPVAVWERELTPGPYFLRHILPDGRCFEGSVVVCAGWVTQVAIQRAAPRPADATHQAAVGTIGDAAVFMRPAGGAPRSADQDAVIEAARLALVQGRNLFGDGHGAELQELLLQKYGDPVAGIIGAHLLLRAIDGGKPDAALTARYDEAVRALRDLVGTAHPDVEALSLRCADPTLRAEGPFGHPPMFSHGWQLVTAASYGRPSLVPQQLWQRVHAAATLGPFFVWAVDDDTRAAHAELLSRWIDGFAATGPGQSAGAGAGPPTPAGAGLPPAARDAALQAAVPASGANALWAGRSGAG